VEALRPLEKVCRDFKINFELFGGAVTRIERRFIEDTQSGSTSIFDLAGPFNDLDLSHSGSPDLNTDLQIAVLSNVPNAECIRWDIRSSVEWSAYREAAQFNNRIPVRMMSLSTDATIGLRDSQGGLTDLREQKYRYERNPSYPASPLFRRGQDLEFFSGLIYLNALVESDLAPNEQAQQLGVSRVAEVMRDAHTPHTVIALQESSYLRSRLHYLLASLAAHCPDEQVLRRAEIRGVLTFLSDNDQQLSSRLSQVLDGPKLSKSAIITSARIGGDVYRAPQMTVAWEEGSAALALFNEVLGTNQSLGDNEDIILASPQITINSGLAPSNARTDHRRMQLAQEFMSINLNIPTLLDENKAWCLKNPNSPYQEEDLAIFMAVRPSSGGPWSVHPLPADIRLRQSRALIRLNAWGLLDQLSSDQSGTIRLFIAGWKPR
jgi:hypothetical protein